MTTAKQVILTSIASKGVDSVRENAEELASNALCSKAYVLKIARDVEKSRIIIQH